jgi:phospholipid/cholesterol/gamma-HCH transport system permease protein
VTVAPLGDVLERVGNFLAFTGRCVITLPSAFVRPAAVWQQLYGALAGTLPLVLVAGCTIGIVSWLQLRSLLSMFDSELLLPSALTLGTVRGLGPVIAGLIAAGRIASGIGAELGSQRISEQIDALSILGVSPLRRLVAPRVLACMIALPLLTLFTDYLAVVSSYVAEAFGGTMTWAQYRLEAIRYLYMRDALFSTLKTSVFGFWIAVSGCWWGLETTEGTEGVGKSATRAVVLATVLVLVSDVFLVRLEQLIPD